jgi:PAS domain S-box-containing protein
VPNKIQPSLRKSPPSLKEGGLLHGVISASISDDSTYGFEIAIIYMTSVVIIVLYIQLVHHEGMESVINSSQLGNTIRKENGSDGTGDITATSTALILESLPVGVLLVNDKGLITQVNQVVQHILGLSAAQLINTGINDLCQNRSLSEPDRQKLTAQLYGTEEQPQHILIEWGDKTLSVSSAIVIGDSTMKTIIATFQDQTREAKSEKAKSTFLAFISHELRTPLNAILGYAEMIREEIYGPITEKQAQASDRIIHNSRQLLDIVSDLLDQAQLEAGKLAILERPFSIAELIKSTFDLIEPVAADKNIRLSSILDPDLPTTINGDVLRLRQILLNLIGNSIKYTQQGYIQLRMYLADKYHWAMEVRDTGEGIPETSINHIFDPFGQVESPQLRKQGSFGLGLSIVKQLAELMGGHVDVTSKVGMGTTFTILLPLHLI